MSPQAVWSVVEVRPGIFELTGEIDAHAAPTLAERLSATTGSSIVLDLGGVTFMDSSGLRVVIHLVQKAQSGGPPLVIERPSAPVVRLFEIAGLSELLSSDDAAR